MLAKLVEDNYKQILDNAINITRRKNYQQAKALINEAYLTLSEKDLTTKKEFFVEYYTATMYNLYIGERSSYNKNERVSTIPIEYEQVNDDWKQIEILLDEANEATIEAICNLSHLGKEKAIKYVELMQFKDRLAPHLKEIFSLHFEQGLSSRKIAEVMESETGYKMEFKSYNRMINEVKQKLNG